LAVVIVTSDGGRSTIPLAPMSVARFYQAVPEALARLNVPDPRIVPIPNGVTDPVPFRSRKTWRSALRS